MCKIILIPLADLITFEVFEIKIKNKDRTFLQVKLQNAGWESNGSNLIPMSVKRKD